MMKSYFALAVSVFLSWSVFAAPTVSDLKVTPIPPWGLAIDYTVSGATVEDIDNTTLVVQASCGGKTYVAKNLVGATACSNGSHRIYWNMAKDGITTEVRNGSVIVSYWRPYCTIDLSSGVNSEVYPIEHLTRAPNGGFNTSEYKTTKLVLKRVNAGSFIMGDNQQEELHRVTLTKPFYMGLFEVTQKQYELVMGSNPSYFKGDVRPVECVSFDMIRGSLMGARWPTSNAVDADSFLGRLRARTGIAFDLPTEAQWEYVCRAGTTTEYSYGDSADGAYMWYYDNSNSQTHEVGTTLPNPWGVYDLHGNVWEWCLDWFGNLSYGENPKGSSSGSYRVARGGSWDIGAYFCFSFCRDYYLFSPSNSICPIGFRLVRTFGD